MAQRKLQQEIDKCFKKVAEGILAFEGIFDKIQQTGNASQKEKLEDALKREIKKLQRLRDQIKSWASSNEIKDKKPLLEQRKLIETQMEKFKAVEKEMKTKAYSKEGLSAAAKLDPREAKKEEACNFLSSMVEELERQIETVEAEAEALQANIKKGKKDTSKAERVAEIERVTERHKWHQGKLELILRSLENGAVDTDQVTDLEDSIKYYVENNQEVDFMEDDEIYDDLNLQEEEDVFNMNNENDRVSSQDTQSIQDDLPEIEGRGTNIGAGKSKPSSVSDPPTAAARRTSGQLKSPLPALATLHTPISNITNGTTNNTMKPAPLPTRAPGETLKYASAAAAAAATDKSGLGIAPLPPPPGAAPTLPNASNGLNPLPPAPSSSKASATTSPNAVHSQLASLNNTPAQKAAVSTSGSIDGAANAQVQTRSPALSHSSVAVSSSVTNSVPQTPALEKVENLPVRVRQSSSSANSEKAAEVRSHEQEQKQKRGITPQHEIAQFDTLETNGDSLPDTDADVDSDESIYHLPPGLQDLIQSFETTKSRVTQTPTQSVHRLLAASHLTCPGSLDAEKPHHYKPQTRHNTPSHYPQEPLPLFDNPQVYSRIDTDTLFYVFYYRQGTYQQYLAAKSLKNQSWRFHKQYQTWFQRHEEPKTITEEFEQGTYRFFDYESTWLAANYPQFIPFSSRNNLYNISLGPTDESVWF
ncbi:MAG: general negative regulator of transcription subunit 5 [Pycnora praestabilis]|nr:MAG: general negative regulator of transcription subunit 5 [Pycnora praestabilis]